MRLTARGERFVYGRHLPLLAGGLFGLIALFQGIDSIHMSSRALYTAELRRPPHRRLLCRSTGCNSRQRHHFNQTKPPVACGQGCVGLH